MLIQMMPEIHLGPGAGGMSPRVPGVDFVIAADGICEGPVESVEASRPSARWIANPFNSGINAP